MKRIEPWQIAACLAALLAPLAGCGRGEEVKVREMEAEEEAVEEPVVTAEEETAAEPVPRLDATAGEPATGTGAVEPEARPEQQRPPSPVLPKTRPGAPPPPGSVPKVPEESPSPAAAKEPEPEPEEATPLPSTPEPATPATTEADAAGKEVFLAQRCGTCHSVSTAGIKAKVASGATAGGDLAGVGKRRDRTAIGAIVRQEEPVDGKKHPKRFTGSQQELDALIDWLQSQG